MNEDGQMGFSDFIIIRFFELFIKRTEYLIKTST